MPRHARKAGKQCPSPGGNLLRVRLPLTAPLVAAHPNHWRRRRSLVEVLCQFSCRVSCSSKSSGKAFAHVDFATTRRLRIQSMALAISLLLYHQSLTVSPLIRSTRLLCSPDISRLPPHRTGTPPGRTFCTGSSSSRRREWRPWQ